MLLDLKDMLMQPLPGKLPALTFFEPTPEYLDWFEKYLKGRNVIDAGAGTARFGARLKDRGIACLSIDINDRQETYDQVLLTNATTFDYPPGCVVTINRPNHGPFLQWTIERAIKCGCTVLVASKRFPDTSFEYMPVYTNAGLENETIYEIML